MLGISYRQSRHRIDGSRAEWVTMEDIEGQSAVERGATCVRGALNSREMLRSIPARYSAAAYMNASGFYVAGLTARA